jgi:hypothetical protein
VILEALAPRPQPLSQEALKAGDARGNGATGSADMTAEVPSSMGAAGYLRARQQR